jgi:hypothetical protein
VHRQVDDCELAVHEVGFAGQGKDVRQGRGVERTPAQAPLLEITVDVVRQRPGVLVGSVQLDGERAWRRRHGVGREHVEASQAERREVTDPHQAEGLPLWRGRRFSGRALGRLLGRIGREGDLPRLGGE